MSQPGLAAGLGSASVLYGAALTVWLALTAVRRRPVGSYGLGALGMLWLGATVVALSTAGHELSGGGERAIVVVAYCLAAVLTIPVLAAPREGAPGAASGAVAAMATVAVLARLAAIA